MYLIAPAKQDLVPRLHVFQDVVLKHTSDTRCGTKDAISWTRYQLDHPLSADNFHIDCPDQPTS
jgi:hypothetical protein